MFLSAPVTAETPTPVPESVSASAPIFTPLESSSAAPSATVVPAAIEPSAKVLLARNAP